MLFPVYAETILEETALFAALLRGTPYRVRWYLGTDRRNALRPVRTETDDTHRGDRCESL